MSRDEEKKESRKGEGGGQMEEVGWTERQEIGSSKQTSRAASQVDMSAPAFPQDTIRSMRVTVMRHDSPRHVSLSSNVQLFEHSAGEIMVPYGRASTRGPCTDSS